VVSASSETHKKPAFERVFYCLKFPPLS